MRSSKNSHLLNCSTVTLSGVSVDESVAAGYTRTVGSWCANLSQEIQISQSCLKLMFFDFEKKNNADRLIFQSVSKIIKSRDERFKTKMTLGSVKGYN